MNTRFTIILWLLLWSSVGFAADTRTFDSDDVALRYFADGQGEPVLLLHGFSGSATGLYIEPGTMGALVNAGYRAIALDQRGHGGSEKPYVEGAYGLNMVEDIRRLLDHLDIDKVHLVGYSMGGKVANAFREHYPDRLISVTLGGYGWPWQSTESTIEIAMAQLESGSILPGNDIRALAAVRVGMHELTASEDSLRNNQVPALALMGDADKVVPKADQEQLKQSMLNLDFQMIPGTHAGPDGAPYKPVFADKLITFLRSIQ